MNINDIVKVKLTQVGIDILKNYHEEIKKEIDVDIKIEIDSDGYYTDQLWHIMYIFGGRMVMGAPMPFETEIIIKEREKGCEYCKGEDWHERKRFYDGDSTFFVVDTDNTLYVEHEDVGSIISPEINFCPMCGKKLGENNG